MATYAVKLRQEAGDLIAKIGSDGQITTQKNMNDVVEASIAQAQDGSVTVAADALVIPVTHAVVVKSIGADAEALTLADGYVGQVLVIHLAATAGGTGTLTPTTATGWATAAFSVAGHGLSLYFVNSTIGWIVLGSYGAAANAAPVIALS